MVTEVRGRSSTPQRVKLQAVVCEPHFGHEVLEKCSEPGRTASPEKVAKGLAFEELPQKLDEAAVSDTDEFIFPGALPDFCGSEA